MAFAGLKKQINKANQYVTEKMGGAEGTKLDLDFMDMERKSDVTVELVEELQVKTKEFLQPNPTARAKMAAVKGISKLSGQAKSNTYPQPEGVLGDCMLLYGRKLGDDSMFGTALVEMGEALKQMADVKYSLDDNIKQNFLEPLHHLQTKDLKEVIHHRKKLQGRRLDFDCKRRRQAKGTNIPDEEIKTAEEKFAESLHLAQMGMFNLLENDVEQISQLATFAEGLLDYHSQCTDVLKTLTETLQDKREEAASRPKVEFVPKTLSDLNIEGVTGIADGYNGTNSLQFNQFNNHNAGNPYNQNFKNPPSNGAHQFRRPAPKTVPIKQMPPSDPFDPWSFSQVYEATHHQRSEKAGGTIKIDGICPSKLIVKMFNTEQVIVVFWKAHAGHEEDLRTKHLTTIEKCNIVKKLEAGIPVFRILEDARKMENPNLERINLLNNMDVHYLMRKHNTEKKRHHNDVVAVRLKVAEWNLHGKNFAFFFKEKGSSQVSSPQHKPQQLELHPGQNSANASPLPSPMKSPARTPMNRQPCCVALYDFDAENPGELSFKENDIITLLNKIDENWFEGSVGGRTGYFPVNYVKVDVALP